MTDQSDDETEAFRLELIAERGDTEVDLQARYAPGSFGCHEALHMASVLSAAVDRELLDHGAILARPEWFALARQAFDALWTLYQAVGAEHLQGEPRDSGCLRGTGGHAVWHEHIFSPFADPEAEDDSIGRFDAVEDDSGAVYVLDVGADTIVARCATREQALAVARLAAKAWLPETP